MKPQAYTQPNKILRHLLNTAMVTCVDVNQINKIYGMYLSINNVLHKI